MECSEKELDHAEVARVRVERATSPWKKTDTAVEVTAVATSRPRAQDGSQLDPSSPDTDTSVMTAQETYPEGGLQAWLVVLGSWLTLFASLGLMNTLAVLETYLASHQLQGYSHAVIGWIFSIYAFLCFFGGIYVGPVFDRHGPRWLLLGGSVCVVASLLILSICTAYWHFLLTFSVLNGLGCALLLTPSLAAVGHWFYVRRGLATGLAATGGSIGGIVYPLMLRSLLPKVGWASSLRIHALVSCLCCMAGNLLVRSRVAPAHDATSRPDLRILKQRAFALVVVATFLLELAMFVPLTYLSSYAVAEGGFSTDFAFALLPVLNAGSVLGRALPGWWADRIGPFQANITATALSGVVCLAVWLPAGRTTAGIVVFAVLFGFASGSNISLTPVCIGRLCRTQHYGRYYATCYVVVSIACLIGIPVAGSIIEACGGRYWGLILFTGLSYCVSVATLWGAMYCL